MGNGNCSLFKSVILVSHGFMTRLKEIIVDINLILTIYGYGQRDVRDFEFAFRIHAAFSSAFTLH